MPLDLTDTVARLSGVVTVQEAEPLLEWVQAHPNGTLDLADCEHLHTAVLQVLLRTGAVRQLEPTDPDLALWLRSCPPS